MVANVNDTRRFQGFRSQAHGQRARPVIKLDDSQFQLRGLGWQEPVAQHRVADLIELTRDAGASGRYGVESGELAAHRVEAVACGCPARTVEDSVAKVRIQPAPDMASPFTNMNRLLVIFPFSSW